MIKASSGSYQVVSPPLYSSLIYNARYCVWQFENECDELFSDIRRIARRTNIFVSHCQTLRLSMPFLLDRLLYNGRV